MLVKLKKREKLGNLSVTGKMILKWILVEMSYEGLVSIQLHLDRVQWEGLSGT
jgi:hypothetical protein